MADMGGNLHVGVALSGGKDSTATILRLLQAGHRVSAFTMSLGVPGEGERLARIDTLCGKLGVPWTVIDLAGEFARTVVEPFVVTYRAGKTPNPCARCNREIKFGSLRRRVLEAGCDLFATGHYAAIVERAGRRLLAEAAETAKSQSYFLALIGPANLERVVFPLAGVAIAEVRARVAGLPLAQGGESQDACFLGGETAADFVQRAIGGVDTGGDFIDGSGRVLGRHLGVFRYTVGQRRGTHFAGGERFYVTAIDPGQNTVTLGREGDLMAAGLRLASPVAWAPVTSGERVLVKIRYATPAAPAEVVEVSESSLALRFLAPQRAVTPGQVGAVYRDGAIVAAGEIAEVERVP